jgi:hypothetical protein
MKKVAQSSESFSREVEQLRRDLDPAGQREKLAAIAPEVKALVREEIAQSGETQASSLMSETKSLRISRETVIRAFEDILGHVPESVDVINQYASLESYQALRETIMRSDEFQSSLAAMPGGARSIYMRRLNSHDVLAEG